MSDTPTPAPAGAAPTERITRSEVESIVGQARDEIRAEVKAHVDPIANELRDLREQVSKLAPLGELATNLLAMWKGKLGATVRGFFKLVALGAGGGIGANAAGILDWIAKLGG